MSVSTATNRRLAVALGSNTAASEVVTILNTGVAGTDGSYATVTTTGDVTVGGDLAVTGTTALADAVTCTKASGTGLAVTANATVGGTLGVTGILTGSDHIKIASGKKYYVNSVGVVGAQAANIATITTTYTSGSAPTPGSTQTIGDSATPTVVELLQYCANIEGKFNDLLAKLKTHGLIASS